MVYSPDSIQKGINYKKGQIVKTENYLKQVKEHYENYPYPKRDLEDEKGGMYVSNSENLTRLNHYGFKGDMPLFKKGKGAMFRVLVAGAGTGDAVIHMAEQLRDFNARVVYLDMSRASMLIAKKRAKLRKLKNIDWIHNSLLELPKIEQQSIAELMAGNLNTHTFYVAHQADTIATLDNLELVPYFTTTALKDVILLKSKQFPKVLTTYEIQERFIKKYL